MSECKLFTALVATSFVALVAASSPAPSVQPGITVPLFKRGSLSRNLDNTTVVNISLLNMHVEAVDAKYKQGMANWQLNTGELDLWPVDNTTASPKAIGQTPSTAISDGIVVEPDDLEIVPGRPANASDQAVSSRATQIYDKRPVAGANKRRRRRTRRSMMKANKAKARRQAEPLANQQNDLLWTGTVYIGSNSQPFLIDMDTGSADFWVPSSQCSSAQCDPHEKYDSSTSSTSQAISGRNFKITYGDGSSASGPVYTDAVTIAGYTATEQYFGAVTKVSDSFGKDVEDGILGMAFQTISELNEPPFFQSLMDQQKVPSPMFSFRLSKTGSELYLGGANANKYTGAIEWSPITSRSYWLIKGAPLVNGKAINGDVNKRYNMAIDSGTTVILAPTADATAFWKLVPGAAPFSGDSSYWTYPCRSPPQVAFTFVGRKWAISPSDFNLGQVSSGSANCIGAIVGRDVGVNAWIMGDAFMKGVYSVFDMGQKRVGFAQPR